MSLIKRDRLFILRVDQQARTPGQALDFFVRQIDYRDARSGQRVVGGNVPSGHFDGNETIRDAAPDVLRGLRLKIPIELVVAAVER